MLTLTRAQLRRLDQAAIEQLGIPGVVLMENAGRAVADETLRFMARSRGMGVSPMSPPFTAALLCGGGNNGGDGYVAARHLHNAGVKVVVFSAAQPAQAHGGDAAVHRAIVEKMGLPRREILDEAQLGAAGPELEAAEVLIDALLGTGFTGDVRPHLAALIRRCNALALDNRKVVAVDVPSGLDCDTGTPSNPTIRADVTVTFAAMKKGFLTEQAKTYVGRIVVASIGTPPELAEKMKNEG